MRYINHRYFIHFCHPTSTFFSIIPFPSSTHNSNPNFPEMGSRRSFLRSWSSPLFLFVVVVALAASSADGSRAPRVPCYFIFGDSLYDSGNNNNLNTSAKVNYSPYGIDLPAGPTGRFSNGQTTADAIGEILGFKDFIPPFASNPDDRQILVGVNYASGSAGILVESGKQGGDNVDLSQQLRNHELTVSRIVEILGSKVAAFEYLGQCLYICDSGNNDYINNYILPQSTAIRNQYNPDQFAALLITQYSAQIIRLYELGARKVALAGISNIGCTPSLIATLGTNGAPCVNSVNQLVVPFNTRLKSLISQLKLSYPDAKFAYLDSVRVGTLVGAAAFRIRATSCCQVSTVTGLCLPNTVPCSQRPSYLFWDAFHPTELANQLAAPLFFPAIQRIL
ncbi:unnamed protein product [Linum tenue]|uniref:GDSL esterase/lipase n=1 Tax=Linum tenue TaxID=586396 RepID=A0AAV0PX86_9ROSI|nr:unnamed protein product [Linum tenue]